MMGAESVAYHRSTVLGRSDDHPGQALAYYASRGETPLVWGGAGAERLGLTGAVTDAQYEAVYGPGGAVDPATGVRLARTRRPGMELVIGAHKSVAELGVLGRPEVMHSIMDAERHATLGYLDALTRERGGRRGRSATSAPTGGLVYAVTRHATSRAGDPAPHDHVLLANVAEMLDERGGHKGADTALWREHLHAATAVGRVASARRAVELGYAIRPDPGPSGRLGHWAIAGIPAAALDVHSTRAAEITAAVGPAGTASYRARSVAARTTRAAKGHEAIGQLLPRWRAELEAAGFPVADLRAEIDRAAAERLPLAERLPDERAVAVVADVLARDGSLARRKVFARRDVVVAVAPTLFGLPSAELDRVVGRILASPETVPLLGVPGARERAYALASVIATEQAIADTVGRAAGRTDASAVGAAQLAKAVTATERRLGRPLTAGQARAVRGIATSGRGAEVVLGVAGAGKTTALAVAADAFSSAGYQVLGTATSGQAARTLGTEAGIAETRTLASLLWRLDHDRIALSERSVVILDEAGMTDDAGLARLLTATQRAGAKVVLVGDDRQLGAVGPGGALGALLARHPEAVHVLDENVRQHDPEERAALAELRAGQVGRPVDWYAANRSIVAAPTRDGALDALVAGWAADVAAGRDAAMFAWRRANVEELNQRARVAMAEAGRLTGPEVVAPGGRRYAAGDRVVLLAPGADGQLVTSERGVVTAVDVVKGTVNLRVNDGRTHVLTHDLTASDRLAHGYAVTVHRSQGLTVEVTHGLEDGGGRELAYVRMSRARLRSTAYVVADDLDQAVEDLRRDWSSERRQAWAIDTGTPAAEPSPAEHLAALQAKRAALAATLPHDPLIEIVAANAELTRLRQRRRDLDTGRGIWAATPVGEAAQRRAEAGSRRRQAELIASGSGSRATAPAESRSGGAVRRPTPGRRGDDWRHRRRRPSTARSPAPRRA